MLPSLSQTTSGTKRRTLLVLTAIAVAALALPTMKWATHGRRLERSFFWRLIQERRIPAASAAVDRRDKASTSTKGRETSVEPEYLPRRLSLRSRCWPAQKPVDVEFLDLALEECVNYLSEASQIPMWLDKQTLTDEGVALDQPITFALKGRRLESVLNLLLTPVQLAYVPENDVLVIATATKAGEKLITRTYPVRDLYQGPVFLDVGEPAQKNEKAAAGGAIISRCRKHRKSSVGPALAGQRCRSRVYRDRPGRGRRNNSCPGIRRGRWKGGRWWRQATEATRSNRRDHDDDSARLVGRPFRPRLIDLPERDGLPGHPADVGHSSRDPPIAAQLAASQAHRASGKGRVTSQ